MNWMQSLYNTYEQCFSQSATSNDEVPLLPICHTTQNAQVEITLNEGGDFRRACIVKKDDARTIIPCTEKSAGRTGEAPHPLCDKLQYVAGDYKKYVSEKNHYFQSYIECLSDWIQSGAPKKVRAVYEYVRKESVISDLIKSGVLFADEHGKLYLERPNKKNKNDPKDIFDLLPGGKNPKTGKLKSWQADAFVRWRVEGIDEVPEVWKSQEVIQSWIDYYLRKKEKQREKHFCYITGKENLIADQHPAKIRNDADKAKIISSGRTISKEGKVRIDDNCGFTFLGRFTHPDQVATVSFEISQKAHSALRWLVNRQGYNRDGLAVVAWATSGEKLVQPTDDSDDLMKLLVSAGVHIEEGIVDTAQDTGIKLKKMLAGYDQKISDREDIVVLAVDSATPGRLSIVYYRELKGSEFLRRIKEWHETCAWQHNYKKFYGAPAPDDIAEAAYGSRLNDELRKNTIKRLIPCIIDASPIPYDLVTSVVRRASNRLALKTSGKDSEQGWDKVLTIACALYRKYRYGKENFDMSLDETRRTRDYLFGRLLAIADVLEEFSLSSAEKNRPTNATRYMQLFSQRPFSTWKQIHEQLTPYFMQQGNKASYYKRLIGEVQELFEPADFMSNKPLTGEYLLGYYCQRQKLKEKKNKDNAEKEKDSN